MSRVPLWQLSHCAGADLVCDWCGQRLPRQWKAWKLKCPVGLRERWRRLREELREE